MLQIQTHLKLDQIESELRMAAERHGGSVLAASHVGHLVQSGPAGKTTDAITFTMCFSGLYAPLLNADVRFAAFLPSRIAACARGDNMILETMSPREYCRLIHRTDVEPLANSLEHTLRLVMEEAAQPAKAHPYPATEDMVNMRAAVPQRIDCHGTKVEELAGTGAHDAAGG